MHVSEAEVAARAAESQLLVIEAEELQNRGVEIVNVNFVFRGRETVFVRRTVNDAAFDAAAGHHMLKPW